MKRLHIHVGVKNLDQSIRFYSALFGMEPVKIKPDYAKWMIDNPHVNFAISTRTGETGVDHLGIQVEEESELSELRDRLKKANMTVIREGESVCCYARSEKSWVHDPAGIPWEAYLTMEDADTFKANMREESTCCTPQANSSSFCAPEAKTGNCC
jgi:catechol 2,3-dioxygenase-like lactoylglutathione lyase family enzyme